MRGLIGALRTVFVGATIAAVPVVAPVVAAAPAYAASACTSTSGVTVIVDFTHLGGSIERGCAPSPSNGLDALHQAGFGTNGTARWGDAFVCRIDGKPGASSEACVNTPPSTAYWAFWHANSSDGGWTYSSLGVLSYTPPSGSIEGWAFGAGARPCIAPANAIAGSPPPPQPACPPPGSPASATIPPPSTPVAAPQNTTAGGTSGSNASSNRGSAGSGNAGAQALGNTAAAVKSGRLSPTPTVALPNGTPVNGTAVAGTGKSAARAGAVGRTNHAPVQTTPSSTESEPKVVERQALGQPIRDSSGGSSALPALLTVLFIAGVGGGVFLVARRRRSPTP